jgi:tellurite resistance protein TerC
VYAFRWVLLVVVVIGACVIDLGAHRGDRADSAPRAALWSVTWIALGFAFCAWIALAAGSANAGKFLAAYLLEETLSLDNMFIFFLIFQGLRIDVVDQRRVLFWGVAGAVVMRGAFIAVGARTVEHWHVVLYGFGLLLVFLALRTAFGGHGDNEVPQVVPWLERHLRVAPGVRRAFFVRIDGRVHLTSLAIALLAVESSDVVFAVDSIPTAFAVTESPFLLYSSNVLAVLGLRALYLVVATFLTRLRTLRFGLAVILLLAGLKLLLRQWVHVPPWAAVLGPAQK